MTLTRFKASNHPQQTGRRGAKPEIDDRATPPELFDPLNERFHFTIDVAASAENTKCKRFYTPEMNALLWPWTNERVWCNPPYSDIRPWVEKAWAEMDHVIAERPELIVMLLPANRTEQGWWQDLVEPYRDAKDRQLSVEFLRGRQRFICRGETEILPNQRPPFGCCLLIWRP